MEKAWRIVCRPGVHGINGIILSGVRWVRDLLIFSKVRIEAWKEEKARQITVL